MAIILSNNYKAKYWHTGIRLGDLAIGGALANVLFARRRFFL